jgi:hypothetical protein
VWQGSQKKNLCKRATLFAFLIVYIDAGTGLGVHSVRVALFDGGAFVKWRFAVIVLVVLFTAAVRVAVGVPQTPAPSLTVSGQVDIAMGPDGKLMVLVDEATASQPSDGLVEHAFRLQGADSLTYSGQATVTYTRGRLTVQMAADTGWVFSVAGRTLPPPDPGLTAYTVGGIAHAWGEAVHTSPATLFSTLSAAPVPRRRRR